MPGEGATQVPPALQVRLAAALGKRALVDGATGQPIPQFSAPLLRPTKLPPGYRLRQISPELTGPQGHPVVRVELWYHVRDDGAGYLVIAEYPDSPLVPRPWQSPLESGPPPAKPARWSPIRVRGVPGWAAPSTIAWRQRGLIYSITTGTPMTTTQLTAIADSATG
jgi:hypothetical protein